MKIVEMLLKKQLLECRGCYTIIGHCLGNVYWERRRDACPRRKGSSLKLPGRSEGRVDMRKVLRDFGLKNRANTNVYWRNYHKFSRFSR